MSFTSLPFLALTAGGVVLYYIAPLKSRWLILLAASWLFYFQTGLIGYLIAVTLITWLAGHILDWLNQHKGTDAAAKKRCKNRKKAVVATALVLLLGLLFAVKYLGGFTDLINRVTGAGFKRIDLLVPMGISYYIFQSLGYVVDCYRGKVPSEKNILKYALFVAFYPQMVQGPISRHRELAPQLLEGHPFQAENLRNGIQLALWGYFKKLVIADRVGVAVATVFSDSGAYDGSILILAVFFYCIQLYCDFSGGIDIARGIAELFGIHLAENFRQPVFATSLADYWRRWHITLGGWMRDYVFYPLSLSKLFGRLGRWSRKHIGGIFGKILPTSLATFVIYLLIGIWHGSNPKYIVYGFWNGTIITLSLLLEPIFEKTCAALHINREGAGWQIWQTGRTLLLVFIGRYITRASGIRECISMLSRSITDFHLSLLPGQAMALGMTQLDFLVVTFGMIALLILEWIRERGTPIRETLARKNAFLQYLLLLLPLAAVLIFGIWIKGDIATGFIYGNF